jgi:hypothetical protein
MGNGIENPQQNLGGDKPVQGQQAQEFDPDTMGSVPTGKAPKPEFKVLTPGVIQQVKIFMDDQTVQQGRRGGDFHSGYIQLWITLDAPQKFPDGNETRDAVENYSIRFYKVKGADGAMTGFRAYFGSDNSGSFQESYAHALRKLVLDSFGDLPGVDDSISVKAFKDLLLQKKVMIKTDEKSANKKIVVRQFVRT